MIALDASVLIAHLNPVDSHHDAATRILLDASADSLIVHTVTLAEVLVGGVRIGRGAEMRDDCYATGLRLARHDEDEPLRLAELRAMTGLKLPDCCVLYAATTHAASVATFDQALADMARGQGLTVLPGTVAARRRARSAPRDDVRDLAADESDPGDM